MNGMSAPFGPAASIESSTGPAPSDGVGGVAVFVWPVMRYDPTSTISMIPSAQVEHGDLTIARMRHDVVFNAPTQHKPPNLGRFSCCISTTGAETTPGAIPKVALRPGFHPVARDRGRARGGDARARAVPGASAGERALTTLVNA